MVDVIGRAKVIITGDVDANSIDQAGGKIGRGLKVGATVGVAALGTLTVAGVKAFKAFEEGEAVSAKLSNVLGNMGKTGAVEEVEKLATSLQRATGVSDDTIKSGQTLLATFSEVAASAGETGGVFDRATRAAVDLSAAGFGSVESSAKTLGKALQDPVRGISALGRAGVTFTEEQKKLIEGFVEANDVASAQAIILGEVEKQVKGTGEASAKESQKISEAFGEIEESAGELLSVLLGGDGKGKNSLSGELFKVSDAISDLANSKDWKNFSKDARDTGKAVATVAKPLADVYRWGNKIADATPGWGSNWKLLTPPIQILAEGVKILAGAFKAAYKWADKLGGELEGNSGIPDIGGGTRTSLPDSDFIDEITGRASGGPARGLTLVGENGPELARFGSGGYVYNNSQTRGMLAGAATAQRVTHLHFHGPENLAEARRREDWSAKYGTRFGAATNAGAM